MSIRAKISVFTTIFIILFVSSVLLLVSLNARNSEIYKQRIYINDILYKIFEINILSKDLLLKNNERSIKQWEASYKNLQKAIELAHSIRLDDFSHNILHERVIEKSVALYEYYRSFRNNDLSKEMKLRVLKNMDLTSLEMTSAVQQCKDLVMKKEKKELKAYNYGMLTIFTSNFALLLWLIIFYLFNIGRPLISLNKDIKKIKDGDLTHVAEVHHKDEIGAVAMAFNELKIQLAEAYAVTKKHNLLLEHEIGDRIAEIQKASADLSTQKETFEMLLNGIDDVIYVADPETYELIYFNETAEKTWGEGQIGKKCHKVLQDRDEPCPFCTNYIIFGEKLGTTHYWEFKNEVNEHWYRCADKAIKWLDGRKVRFELASDINELKQARLDLEESNKELEQFAYVASHDLQEPLRKINSFSELFARKFSDLVDETGERYLFYITDGTKRMQNLISDLLTLSRINTQGCVFKKVDIYKVMTQISELFSDKLDRLDGRIIYNELPVIFGDEGQITQLFQNLIGNAIKFRRSDVKPKVEITFEANNKEWIFYVKDNGIGINSDYFERVFVIFQRLHSKEKFSGTGIGLAICKQIVNRHGGKISIESEVGNGSTFRFSIAKPK